MLILKKVMNNLKSNKSLVIILGSLLIIVSISLVSYKLINNNIQDKQENKAIEEFYNKEQTNISDEEKQPEKVQNGTNNETTSRVNYVAVLKIPKINLVRGLVSKNSRYNNVNYNLEILDDSDTPDVVNGNVMIAGHSGSARISYFRNLDKLSIGDEITLDYQNKTYTYKVSNIYDIEKTGNAVIKRDNNKFTLTLITCRHNTNRQIVVVNYLYNVEVEKAS